jgi:hypothetical protein
MTIGKEKRNKKCLGVFNTTWVVGKTTTYDVFLIVVERKKEKLAFIVVVIIYLGTDEVSSYG